MNLEIANMISKLVSFIQSIDWGNFFTTLFGAGFGSYSAYRLNIYLKNKATKDEEKGLLIKLMCDLCSIGNHLYYYYKNICASEHNLIEDEIEYLVPLSIETLSIDLKPYSFITKNNHDIYVILSYLQSDLSFIFEQDNILNNISYKKRKLSLQQIISIKILLPKFLAKVYCELLNINKYLMFQYKSENVIDTQMLKTIEKIKEIITKAKNEYSNIISKEGLICPYTRKPYTQERKETAESEIEYLEHIFSKWQINFKLSPKQQAKIDKISAVMNTEDDNAK